MEQNDITISARDVAMRFRLTDDKILSLKEFVTRKIRGKLKTSEFWALKGVSFDVHKGEVLGIIGRNGSGKSTLLKCISGILKPTRGSVTCHGNIVPMLELGSGFDPDLTGRENVFLNGAILGYTEEFLKEKFNEIHEFSELGDFIDVPIRNYSSGMMARLAFSVATVVNPQILIVDEILSVGDESFQAKSRADDGADERRHHGAVRESQSQSDPGDVRPCPVAGQRRSENVRRNTRGVRRVLDIKNEGRKEA